MITQPQLPPKVGYTEVEVDGVRTYCNVTTGLLIAEETVAVTPQEAAMQRIDGKCSAAIYRGLTLDNVHYVFTDRAQADWAAAFIAVLDGATTVTVKINNEWMDYPAATVRAVYNKMREFILVARWYNEELVAWITTETDEAVLDTINFGVQLPAAYAQDLNTRCTAKNINLADYVSLLN